MRARARKREEGEGRCGRERLGGRKGRREEERYLLRELINTCR